MPKGKSTRSRKPQDVAKTLKQPNPAGDNNHSYFSENTESDAEERAAESVGGRENSSHAQGAASAIAGPSGEGIQQSEITTHIEPPASAASSNDNTSTTANSHPDAVGTGGPEVDETLGFGSSDSNPRDETSGNINSRPELPRDSRMVGAITMSNAESSIHGGYMGPVEAIHDSSNERKAEGGPQASDPRRTPGKKKHSRHPKPPVQPPRETPPFAGESDDSLDCISVKLWKQHSSKNLEKLLPTDSPPDATKKPDVVAIVVQPPDSGSSSIPPLCATPPSAGIELQTPKVGVSAPTPVPLPGQPPVSMLTTEEQKSLDGSFLVLSKQLDLLHQQLKTDIHREVTSVLEKVVKLLPNHAKAARGLEKGVAPPTVAVAATPMAVGKQPTLTKCGTTSLSVVAAIKPVKTLSGGSLPLGPLRLEAGGSKEIASANSPTRTASASDVLASTNGNLGGAIFAPIRSSTFSIDSLDADAAKDNLNVEGTAELIHHRRPVRGYWEGQEMARKTIQAPPRLAEAWRKSAACFGGGGVSYYGGADWRASCGIASSPLHMDSSNDARPGPRASVHNAFYKMRLQTRRFVEWPWFEHISCIAVVINAAVLGMQIDWQARELSDNVPIPFLALEFFFCAFFTTELALRLFGFPNFPAEWKWIAFDSLLVGIQLVELTIWAFQAAAAGTIENAGSSKSTKFSIMRVLRLLRLIRVMRLLRVLKAVNELRTLVMSIYGSLKWLVWAMMMLGLVIYILGIFFTQLASDHRMSNVSNSESLVLYWGSLGDAVYSLYQAVMGGLDWGDVVEPLRSEISILLVPFFSGFIAFSILCMLNIITGVFVEQALLTAKRDKEVYMISHLYSLFKAADVDCSGCISWQEFSKVVAEHDMQEVFRQVDMDITEAETLFKLLDVDRHGEIDVGEFISGCNRLRGPAKSVDLTFLSRETESLVDRFHSNVIQVERHFEYIEEFVPILAELRSALLTENGALKDLLMASKK